MLTASTCHCPRQSLSPSVASTGPGVSSVPRFSPAPAIPFISPTSLQPPLCESLHQQGASLPRIRVPGKSADDPDRSPPPPPLVRPRALSRLVGSRIARLRKAKAQARLFDVPRSTKSISIDLMPLNIWSPLGRTLDKLRYSANKSRTGLPTKYLADLPELNKTGCFFWPFPGLAPPKPDQRPLPRNLYITIPYKRVPVASRPLDRFLDLSQLQHLDVGCGYGYFTDLSWLPVIPTTLRTICIHGAEDQILLPLFEGLRRQTQLESLVIQTPKGHSIADFNPLKYFPTLRRLEVEYGTDFEQLIVDGHQCLETLQIGADWGWYDNGEEFREFPAHHPAHRFVDALCAARAKDPSVLPALRTLMLPMHELCGDPECYDEVIHTNYYEDALEWGLGDMMLKLQKEGVEIADPHGFRLYLSEPE